MKKFCKIFATVCLILLTTLAFAACNLDFKGEQGLSAYEIAVKNGFEGSEREWLDSLVHENTYQVTNVTYNVNGQNADLATACNIGLRSVVSVSCKFTKLVNSGNIFYPSTTEQEYSVGGAGVVYSLEDDGSAFIITNHHVVYDAESMTSNKISDQIFVFMYGMEYSDLAIPAVYVGGSMYYDVAVLRVNQNDIVKTAAQQGRFCAVQFANSDNVAVGQTSIAIGNPEGQGIAATTGIVSVDSEQITMTAVDNKTTVSYRVMRTDTPINHGNSGGGFFDTTGKLIGIVNAKMTTSTTENIAYAIPANLVKNVVENIIYHCYNTNCETVMRAMLGVTIHNANVTTVVDENGLLHKVEKIEVSEISAESLAFGILQVGDILVKVKIADVETEITRQYQLPEAMLAARLGDKVTLTIIRNGQTLEKEFTVTQGCIIAY